MKDKEQDIINFYEHILYKIAKDEIKTENFDISMDVFNSLVKERVEYFKNDFLKED